MVYVSPYEKRRAKAKAKKPASLFNNKHWQACHQDWLKQLKDVRGSHGTVLLYELYTRLFFTDPRRTPATYTQQEVLAFINEPLRAGRRKGEPPAPSTRNAKLTALTSFYRYAMSYDIPFRKTTRPIMARRPPTHNIDFSEIAETSRSMSVEDIRQFFAVIPDNSPTGLRDRAIFLTMLYTSRRLSEVLHLTWGDIKQNVPFSDGRVGVQYGWVGKRKVTKTTAELPQAAWEAIVRYLQISGRWDNMLAHTPLFVSHDTAKQSRGEEVFLCKISIGARHRLYVKAAQLSHIRGTHTFRHTCAVDTYIESGYNILEVKRKLDHDSIESTMKYVRGAVPSGDPTAAKLRARYGSL